MKKVKYKRVIKITTSLILATLIFSINLFSIVASAYGGTLDFGEWDSISVFIRNVGNGKYIAEPNGELYDGKEVVLQDGEETLSQRWSVYYCGNGYYSFHSAWDENYVLSVDGGKDVVGARLVLMYVSNVLNVPDNARFKLRNSESSCITYLQSKVNVNNSTRNVISYNQSENTITNEMAWDLYDSAAHQLSAFESPERSVSLLGWDLVDIGGHCDWVCETNTYASMVSNATSAWNEYIGDEVFRSDVWYRIKDVSIKELKEDPTGGNSFGCTYPNNYYEFNEEQREYTSSIYLYTDEMKLLGNLQIQKVVMHELGHALGLGHNRESDSSDKLGNIMQQGDLPYGTFVGLDDIASAEEVYNDY